MDILFQYIKILDFDMMISEDFELLRDLRKIARKGTFWQRFYWPYLHTTADMANFVLNQRYIQEQETCLCEYYWWLWEHYEDLCEYPSEGI